ncbi:hypothetical protein F4804DRAFT_338452 [Jackrogersella minutella]|nr:hypothetical protein F4804DRAFT_338452 [Jackrogersella minutella]
MSDLSAMASPFLGSPLERLSPELIVEILSHLPRPKSILAFGLSSRQIYKILRDNESTIARNMAVTIIGNDDPRVVNMAFTACQARLVQDPTLSALRELLKTYVHPNNGWS